MGNHRISKTFVRLSWGVLLFNIFVILWGAYVRASGSGAGCGSHWPTCNGEVIPRAPQFETIVEFTHRLTSGLAFLLVLGMFVWVLRNFSKGDPLRTATGLSLAFMITEALIGAGLVLFKWVNQDASTGRAIGIVVHLVNTFLLLASLSWTAWLASRARLEGKPQQPGLLAILLVGLAGMLVLGASGALTALGDTLFPVQSLSEGVQQDFSSSAHFLIRLRILHPSIAMVVGAYLILLAGFIRLKVEGSETRRFTQVLTLGILLQLGAGLLNVLLLAPVWMQIVHLFLADTIWIILVLLTYSSLGLGYNTQQ
jgi:heme A synthase